MKNIFLIVVSFLIGRFLFFYIPDVTNPSFIKFKIKKNSCAIQYNTCFFSIKSIESWEKTCESKSKEFKINEVGERKVVLSDLENNGEYVYPKTLFRQNWNPKEDPSINSLFLYLTDCKTTNIIKREIKDFAQLADKCIILEKDCPLNTDNYCHPIMDSFKVEKFSDIRKEIDVSSWFGHGRLKRNELFDLVQIPFSTKEVIPLDKLSSYKEVDCVDLEKKYPHNFNIKTGLIKNK